MLLRKINFILGWIFRKHWLAIGILLAAFVVGLISYPEAAKNTCDTSQLAFSSSSKINYDKLNCEFDLDTWSQVKWSFVNLFIDPGDNLKNNGLRVSQLLSYLAMAIVVLGGLFKESILVRRYKWIERSKHTLVIGLGENNRVYLDSEFEAKNASKIIIIEADKNNPHLDAYNDKGFGIFVGTLEDYSVNFCKLDNVIISAGSDRLNIDIAGELVAQINKDIVLNKLDRVTFGCNTTVLIHLSNPDYKAILHKSLLMPKVAMPLEFKVFSYEDEAARSLFEYDTVLGDYFDELVETEKDYSIIIIGDGLLAERVIYHLVMMASLPNQNKLTLYCYSKNSSLFIERLRSNFNCFDQYLDHIVLKGVDVDFDIPAAYTDDLWKRQSRPNLSQIYVCHDDEATNLEMVLNLHDKIYLTEILATTPRRTLKTKIHFAMFHNLALGDSISNNNEEFKQFFGFGDSRKVFHRDHLIEEAHEKISKRIHKGYGEFVDFSVQLDQSEVEAQWLRQAQYSDRESNRSQALHFFTKLKVLAKPKEPKKNTDLTDDMFSSSSSSTEWKQYVKNDLLQKSGLTLQDITMLGCQVNRSNHGLEVEKTIIDNVFNKLIGSNCLLSQLVISEHERWNTFHYLNGWTAVDEGYKKKPLKHHDCLKPLGEFKSTALRQTILYDLYSVLYIPKYLNVSSEYRTKVLDLINLSSDKGKSSVALKNSFCLWPINFKKNWSLLVSFKGRLLSLINICFKKIKHAAAVWPIKIENIRKQLYTLKDNFLHWMNCETKQKKVARVLNIWLIQNDKVPNQLDQFESQLLIVDKEFKDDPGSQMSTVNLHSSFSNGHEIMNIIDNVLDNTVQIKAVLFIYGLSSKDDVVDSYVAKNLRKNNIDVCFTCGDKDTKNSDIQHYLDNTRAFKNFIKFNGSIDLSPRRVYTTVNLICS